MNHSNSECKSIELAWRQGQAAFEEFLGPHVKRLERMVRVRLDAPLKECVRPMQVIQQACDEAFCRIESYLADPAVSFFVWLRALTLDSLAGLHDRYLGPEGSSPWRDLSIYRGALPKATSAAIAAHLIGRLPSPTPMNSKTDVTRQLHLALHNMNEMDREVLCLRHFEQLTQFETAEVLGICNESAATRHLRALCKLRTILHSAPRSSQRGSRK